MFICVNCISACGVRVCGINEREAGRDRFIREMERKYNGTTHVLYGNKVSRRAVARNPKITTRK